MIRYFLFIGFLILVAFSVIKKPTPYQFPELKFLPKMPVSDSNPVTKEGANLGRHLFMTQY